MCSQLLQGLLLLGLLLRGQLLGQAVVVNFTLTY
jgi:hypothetical protein